MRQYLLLLLSLLLILIIVPNSFAQAAPDSDKDGIIDRSDRCPNDPGPASNNGCPVASTNPQATRNPDDRDGDGNLDSLDRCPDAGGPASNGGCPEGEPQPCPEGFTGANCSAPENPAETESNEPLPTLPTDGACHLATIGRERVNVRDIPDLQGNIVGQLSPFILYPVYLHVLAPNAEDEWFLVDSGWVSGLVIRWGGLDCRQIPTVHLPATHGVQVGGVELVFVDFPTDQFPTDQFPTDQFPTDQFPTDQLPPFFAQACDGSLKISWALQDFHFCDGSVMPTDQRPSAERGSIFECDGSVMPTTELLGAGTEVSLDSILIGLLLPAVQVANDSALEGILIGLLLPAVNELDEIETSLEGILIGLLLPAVQVAGDGSVVPSDALLGDGSVRPSDDCSLNSALIFGDSPEESTSGGKVQFQDFHFLTIVNDGDTHGIIAIMPTDQIDNAVDGLSLNFGLVPPDGVDWTQIGSLLFGQLGGDTFICPAELGSITDGTSNNAPSTGFEEVGFNPQPDPPRECVMVQKVNQQ